MYKGTEFAVAMTRVKKDKVHVNHGYGKHTNSLVT